MKNKLSANATWGQAASSAATEDKWEINTWQISRTIRSFSPSKEELLNRKLGNHTQRKAPYIKLGT